MEDPFTGTWKFDFQRSTLDTPFPVSWTQTIGVTPEEIVVTENIVRSNDQRSTVKLWARFDGTEYPIQGFPLADTIAYSRENSHRIHGIRRKNGLVTVTETVSVSPDGRYLTLVYSLQTGASQPARGVAVFERTEPEAPRYY